MTLIPETTQTELRDLRLSGESRRQKGQSWKTGETDPREVTTVAFFGREELGRSAVGPGTRHAAGDRCVTLWPLSPYSSYNVKKVGKTMFGHVFFGRKRHLLREALPGLQPRCQLSGFPMASWWPHLTPCLPPMRAQGGRRADPGPLTAPHPEQNPTSSRCTRNVHCWNPPLHLIPAPRNQTVSFPD